MLAALAAAAPAEATTLFSDDFEAYAAGSNLIGQGGWAAVPGFGGVVNVANGTFLPTKVLNGFDSSGSPGSLIFTGHLLAHALDPSAITTLSFDAYMAAGQSNDQGIGLSANIAVAQNIPEWFYNRNLGGWQFDTPGVPPPGYLLFPGGADTPVKLAIVVDGITDEIYGRYDFGGGFIDTPHFAASDAVIASINGLGIVVDFRGTVGGEFDNLVVADNFIVDILPEPASLLLLGSGLAGMVWRRRIFARR